MKPKIFIGSSREGLDVARAVGLLLSEDAEVTLWNEGAFGLSHGILESLVGKLEYFDFAILVLTPDDALSSRGEIQNSARDNVLLELGLFLGRLGRDRTFVVVDPGVKLPTDLAGVTMATFYEDRSDKNLVYALSPACTLIRDSIRKQGLRGFVDNGALGSSALRDRGDLINIKDMAVNASEIWACGVTLISLVTMEVGFLEKKLKAGCSFRFLMLDPASPAMDMWHKGVRFATPYDSDSCLRLLKGIAVSSGVQRNCEIRFLSILPPFSCVIAEPHGDDGCMNMELLAIKVPLAARPHLHIKRKDDERWFDFFVHQFEVLWSNGEGVDTAANPAAQPDVQRTDVRRPRG